MNNGPNKVTYKLISKSKKTSRGSVNGAQVVQITDWGDEVKTKTLHCKLNNSGDSLVYNTKEEKFAINIDTVIGW